MNKQETQTAICINDKTERDRKIKVLGITEGKEYQVKPSKYANYYELVNDQGNVETYFMDRFEILENPKWIEKFYSENGKKAIENIMVEIFGGHSMEDKTIKVRCIDTGLYKDITKDKEYKVIEEERSAYYIYNDYQVGKTYPKNLFKPVESQKEPKEYSVMELLDFPVGTKFKSENTIVEVAECAKDNKVIILSGADITSGIRVTTANRDYKFTLVGEPKPVTTAEAFKALDEFKTIISTATANKYRKHLTGNYIMIYLTSNDKYVQREIMETRELEGQWIICE